LKGIFVVVDVVDSFGGRIAFLKGQRKIWKVCTKPSQFGCTHGRMKNLDNTYVAWQPIVSSVECCAAKVHIMRDMGRFGGLILLRSFKFQILATPHC